MITLEAELGPRRLRQRWLPVMSIMTLTAVAQALLAVAIALGGDPFVGAVAAAVLAVCGLALVSGAIVQTRGGANRFPL